MASLLLLALDNDDADPEGLAIFWRASTFVKPEAKIGHTGQNGAPLDVGASTSGLWRHFRLWNLFVMIALLVYVSFFSWM
jgi:hypothetical protein